MAGLSLSLQERGRTLRRLFQDAAAFSDDQFIAGLQIAFDNFCVDTVVEAELDGDRRRLPSPQDPKSGRTIGRRSQISLKVAG
jgi:hypothetical protein